MAEPSRPCQDALSRGAGRLRWGRRDHSLTRFATTLSCRLPLLDITKKLSSRIKLIIEFAASKAGQFDDTVSPGSSSGRNTGRSRTRCVGQTCA
jgi:hypothetical protein